MTTRIAVAVFVGAIVVANLTVAQFGPWVSPINAFFLIGLDLTLRDHLHEKWRTELWRMGALILTAGVVSYALNPAAGRIAVASALAFTISALTDATVYHRLINLPFVAKATGSNAAGAAVDSILFPAVAFGFFPGVAAVIALQFAAKVGGGALWTALISWSRR